MTEEENVLEWVVLVNVPAVQLSHPEYISISVDEVKLYKHTFL